MYAILFLVLAAGATLVLPIATKNMIDYGFANNTDLSNASLDHHFTILFVVAVCMGVFSATRFYWVSWLGERVVADVRVALYRHISQLSPAFFEHTRTGEVISRLNTDSTLIDTAVGSSISFALRSSAILLGSTIMLIITSPKMAALMGLVIPVIIVPIVLFGRRIRKLSRQNQDQIADFSALATESINAIHTVQSFAAERFENTRFVAAVTDAFIKARQRILFSAIMSATVVIALFGGVTFILKSGADDVIAGVMSAGTLSQFVLYAVFAAGSIGGLSEVWGQIQRAAGAVERIAELMKTESSIKNPPNPLPFAPTRSGSLSIEQLSFAYPSRLKLNTLTDFSLDIQSGETVALVGPSGAGKTTVLDLLLRFYDPQVGRILVDGIDIKRADLTDLRQRFGVVLQHTEIFSCSAADNIRYGLSEISDQQIEQAARVALADEFIRELQEGYDTYLGERGVRLSGGQQQRIAIARAIVRDPHFLLLDEATSSLDAKSEMLVQNALDNIMAERTTLVIAHRLATVQKADRIVVMDAGRIVAQGNHHDLIQQDGIYREFAALQFFR